VSSYSVGQCYWKGTIVILQPERPVVMVRYRLGTAILHWGRCIFMQDFALKVLIYALRSEISVSFKRTSFWEEESGRGHLLVKISN